MVTILMRLVSLVPSPPSFLLGDMVAHITRYHASGPEMSEAGIVGGYAFEERPGVLINRIIFTTRL